MINLRRQSMYFCPLIALLSHYTFLSVFMKHYLNLPLLVVFLASTTPLFSQDFNVQLRSTLEYPGQTLANISGYAQDGREYALVGASQGLSIVDVTDPESPTEIVQIPGPNNLWKEIKVYSHYAYVTSEGGQGVQIVDLSDLPSPNLNYHYYQGTGEIEGALNTIHALHIDLSKGFLYTFGGNFSSARVHDLNADPYFPVYVGKYDQLNYIHDGFADNDTLYACHIYSGLMAIVDMRDKQNPVVLGTVETPGRFTHNTWLTDDHKTALTTDETTPSFLTSYDISDPTDIKELDRYSPNDGNGSIGHNTHVLNDYAITSWYTDGFTIVDAHKPDNLVPVGMYDTWPQASGAGFDGCWGVFPFLPSGNILATNIPNTNGGTGTLFVLTPNYQRASYLEGQIMDGCTGTPLSGADISLAGTLVTAQKLTNNNGIFKTGIPEAGTFSVTISKPGYIPQTVSVDLNTGAVTMLNITLERQSAFNINGKLTDLATGNPLSNISFSMKGDIQEYKLQTNANGQFDLSCLFGGNYRLGAWGYRPAEVLINSDGSLTVALETAYYDDFDLDLGWTATSTANDGFWTLGEPVGTYLFNQLANPDQDNPNDVGDRCYVTGNGGGSAGNDDVDGGSVTLISPLMRLASYSDAILTFDYWFVNGGGNNSPNDRFEIQLLNGQESVIILTETSSLDAWRNSGEIHLADYLPLTDNMQIRFIAYDDNPGHVVEAAVDVFEVVPGLVSAFEPDANASLHLSPNPTSHAFRLQYNWPEATDIRLEVRNLVGQLVTEQALAPLAGVAEFGAGLPKGVYLVSLKDSNGRYSKLVKAVKQ
ncbi:MAG: choice-of-anchor B family protein [Bacteroidetes bacterium]|nr:MAG: choice-of-anchor B family protein [Bacteroidota bacterium]